MLMLFFLLAGGAFRGGGVVAAPIVDVAAPVWAVLVPGSRVAVEGHDAEGGAAGQNLPRGAMVIVLDDDDGGFIRSLLVRPKRDATGRLPREVVHAFFEAVAAGEAAEAEAHFADATSSTIRPRTFAPFYAEVRSFDRIVIGATGDGKGDRYVVPVFAFRGRTNVWNAAFFTVEMHDGFWKIARGGWW